MMKVDEGYWISSKDRIHEFLLLGVIPDGTALILRIYYKHLLRFQIK